MSYFGELILRGLVLLKGKLPPDDETNDWESYFRWRYDSSRPYFAKFPDWDVAGKTVLEIGCGIGGRTAYIAAAGAKKVVGIDVNAPEIEIAKQLCPKLYPEISDRVEYLASQENSRLEIGPFDVVVMADVMEHVVSPPQMMRFVYDYLRPGGTFWSANFGWYHYQGTHTASSGMIPFVNLFFSDETILNVIRWLVQRPGFVPSRFDSDPPIERWRGIYDLRDRPGEHLNKLTIRDMKKLARYSIFKDAKLKIVGFGEPHPNLLFRLLNPLRHVPVIQEVFHSLVVLECRK